MRGRLRRQQERGRRATGQGGRRTGVPALVGGLLAGAVLVGAAVAGAWPARAAGGPSAVLTSVHFWTGPESTRLVIETSRPVTFHAVADSASRTVRVTLDGTVPAPDLAANQVVNDGAVRAVHVSETPVGVDVLIETVELSGAAPFSADNGGGPRLVVDVPRPGQAARQEAQARVVRDLTRAHARVVVVDPGHGGEHTGAIGPKKTVEKVVCLAIARRLVDRLNQQPGVRAFLTRDGDYNVALRDRFHFAERLQADAFVSIHANSGKRRNGHGSEVYFLSLESASDEQAKALADVENAADVVGGAPAAEEDLVSILYDLKQNESLHQSSMLAEDVLEEVAGTHHLVNRGVKQAPFAVLKSPVVPSILVETAFINQPGEAKLLRDPAFQKDMAERIARGVLRYLETAPPVARDSTATGALQGALTLPAPASPGGR